MSRWLRCSLVTLIVAVVVGLPAVWHRAQYAHAKRLCVVVPGKLYRSGQLTADGFRDAVRRLGIRTVVNLQDEYPDPDLKTSFLDRTTVKEAALLRELGVKYVFIAPDTLPRSQVPTARPEAIERMLAVMDNPANYPMLIHCRAGLHRTGCMSAIYRMEYEGWTPEQAVEEMKDHGFGDGECTAANFYVYEYVLTYRCGQRRGQPEKAAAR